MRTLPMGLLTCLILASCAVSPEAEDRRLQREASINEILAEPLDPEELGPVKRCLTQNEYRNFSALDDKHMLFEGRRDRMWISTLPRRCPGLRHGDVLVVRPFSLSRICEKDNFTVADWFDWPWYRRWPWRWGSAWAGSGTCTFGEFQPVTETQVAEIKAVLKSR